MGRRRTISGRVNQGQGEGGNPWIIKEIAGGAVPPHGAAMRIIDTTNDPVRLSFVAALLRDAGIDCLVLDAHTSAVEGSIGAIPRRLVVAAADEAQALRVMREAEIP